MDKPVKAIGRKKVMHRDNVMFMKSEMVNNRNIERTQDIMSSFYAGLDPRRRQEAADAGMVREDDRAMSNLSNEFIHREYPRFPFYSSPYIDDAVEE